MNNLKSTSLEVEFITFFSFLTNLSVIQWDLLVVILIDSFIGTTVKVYPVDLSSNKVGKPCSIRAYLNHTVQEFKQLVSLVCNHHFQFV